MKLEFSRLTFENYSNIKFHENWSSGSRVVSCGRAEMTKLIVAFRNFAKAPKKERHVYYCMHVLPASRCFLKSIQNSTTDLPES